jgi:hypothetical protein
MAEDVARMVSPAPIEHRGGAAIETLRVRSSSQTGQFQQSQPPRQPGMTLGNPINFQPHLWQQPDPTSPPPPSGYRSSSSSANSNIQHLIEQCNNRPVQQIVITATAPTADPSTAPTVTTKPPSESERSAMNDDDQQQNQNATIFAPTATSTHNDGSSPSAVSFVAASDQLPLSEDASNTFSAGQNRTAQAQRSPLPPSCAPPNQRQRVSGSRRERATTSNNDNDAGDDFETAEHPRCPSSEPPSPSSLNNTIANVVPHSSAVAPPVAVSLNQPLSEVDATENSTEQLGAAQESIGNPHPNNNNPGNDLLSETRRRRRARDDQSEEDANDAANPRIASAQGAALQPPPSSSSRLNASGFARSCGASEHQRLPASASAGPLAPALTSPSPADGSSSLQLQQPSANCSGNNNSSSSDVDNSGLIGSNNDNPQVVSNTSNNGSEESLQLQQQQQNASEPPTTSDHGSPSSLSSATTLPSASSATQNESIVTTGPVAPNRRFGQFHSHRGRFLRTSDDTQSSNDACAVHPSAAASSSTSATYEQQQSDSTTVAVPQPGSLRSAPSNAQHRRRGAGPSRKKRSSGLLCNSRKKDRLNKKRNKKSSKSKSSSALCTKKSSSFINLYSKNTLNFSFSSFGAPSRSCEPPSRRKATRLGNQGLGGM